MNAQHAKSVRRRILTVLYERYQTDPLDMLAPEDFLEDGSMSREALAPNMHYLGDRGLVELMLGYNPAMFAGVRITADGIDLVENRLEFDRRFPGTPGDDEHATAAWPVVVERLVEEADLSPLDGEARGALLRDVQFLRDELARPAARWRMAVIETVLGWIEANFDRTDEALPSLGRLKGLLAEHRSQARAETEGP